MRHVFCINAGLSLVLLADNLSAGVPADFASATRAPYQQGSDRMSTGKSIAEIRDKVKELWGGIAFEKEGKPVEYLVRLDTDAGPIEVEFYPDVAPNHVRSFLALSQAGFFDGLIFHRCIPNFVIQGGCPYGNGMGGPGYCLKPEFNTKPHLKGTLSMARAQPTDSAGCQFFICTGEPRFLDGKYTVFGRVSKGMDVVDKIVAAPKGGMDRPLNPVKIKKATVVTKGD